MISRNIVLQHKTRTVCDAVMSHQGSAFFLRPQDKVTFPDSPRSQREPIQSLQFRLLINQVI